MRTMSLPRKLATGMLALSLMGGLAACDDNPVSGEEEHAEALLIRNAQGQEVVRIEPGISGPAVTGQLAVAPGSTQTFRTVGISEDGGEVQLGGEFTIAVASQPQNGTVAVQGNDQLVVAGGDTGGSSAFVIQLLHEGHADLEGTVPLVVQ